MTPSPTELLAEAERILASRAADLRGTWPRAVALLTRQALEQTLDDLWRWKAPGTQLASRRAQLLCLGPYVNSETIAQAARFTWTTLSRACHHHPYELQSTLEELDSALRFVNRLRRHVSTLGN
jgi:hypothetical protein